MKIVLGIPSGNRVKKLLNVIEKWQKVCGFDIAVITWDLETLEKVAESQIPNWLTHTVNMYSFAKNHNFIAKEYCECCPDWDVYICGADDLYPDEGVNKIAQVCEQNPGKVIWVRDGLFDALPTHPIITRGWYDKYGYIFDEDFRHNFTDTDLYVRCLKTGELVKCFQIRFDHRHYMKTCEPMDEIYRIGSETFQDDRARFYSKHTNADNVIDTRFEVPEVTV